MKKNLFSIICFLMANFVFAQVVDSTTVKKTTKTTTTVKTTTTIVTTEPIDSVKLAKSAKKTKKNKKEDEDKDIPTDKKNIIKTNLTSFFLATFHLNYERVINQKVTLQLGAYYTFWGNGGIFSNNNNSNNNNNGNGLYGFGITPEIRYYPNGVAPIGFFVAFSPRFQYYVDSYESYNNNGQFGLSETKTATLGAGFIVGRQWLIGDAISLDLYLGPSVNGVISRNVTGYNYNSSLPYASTIGFRLGLTVGFAF